METISESSLWIHGSNENVFFVKYYKKMYTYMCEIILKIVTSNPICLSVSQFVRHVSAPVIGSNIFSSPSSFA